MSSVVVPAVLFFANITKGSKRAETANASSSFYTLRPSPFLAITFFALATGGILLYSCRDLQRPGGLHRDTGPADVPVLFLPEPRVRA